MIMLPVCFADEFEEEGESLIIEVKKYEPEVLRSDFLEQLNVPIFATLGVIRAEPISVPEIKSVRVEIVKQKQAQKENASIKGTSEDTLKKYIQGTPKFYKANPPTLENLGYLKIMLKKIEKEHEVPEQIDLDLKATITYEAERAAFTIGGENLKELNQETEEETKQNKHEREILGGRAYLRVSSIRGRKATMQVYDQNFEKSKSVTLDEGETSRSMNVPGSDEIQPERIRLKLEKVRNTGKIKLKFKDGEEKTYDLKEEIMGDWEVSYYHYEENNKSYIRLRNKDSKTWPWPVLTGEKKYNNLNSLRDIAEKCTAINGKCKIYKDSGIEKLKEEEYDKEEFLEAIRSLEDIELEQFVNIQENIKDKYATFDISGEGDVKLYEGDPIGKPDCECTISKVSSDKVYIKGIQKCETNARSNTQVFETGTSEYICDQAITLKGITTKQEAVISILPGTGRGKTETYFSLHIPVEKRAIQYTPEELQSKINKTQALIKKLDGTISKLQNLVESWTKVCLATAAVFTVMSFFKGLSAPKKTEKEGTTTTKGTGEEITKEITMSPPVGSFEEFSYGAKSQKLGKGPYYFKDQEMYDERKTHIAYTNDIFKHKDGKLYRLNEKGELKEKGDTGEGDCGAGDNSGCREVRFSSDKKDISVGIRSCNQFNSHEYKEKCKEARDRRGSALTLIYFKQEELMQVWWNGKDGNIFMNKNGKKDGDMPMFDIPSNTGEFKSLKRDLTKMQEADRRGEIEYKWGGHSYDIGKGFASGSKSEDVQCKDVMGEGQCRILFNACDPVMCPASRCDFNDRYRVDNVIQSGLIGSLVLCLPNVKDGVVMPVCLSGILASLKNIRSILQGYVQCLQASLENDQSVGICDRIRSVFICQIIWREAMTLLGLAKGNLFDAVVGKGGGEYLTGLKSGVEGAKKTVDFFTRDYATSVFAAYRGRSSKELGAVICEKAIYGKTPILGDILEEVTKAQDPPQFTAYVEEQPYAEVKQQSAYKLYYHIYSGSQTVNYKVYLTKDNKPYTCSECSGTIQAGEFVDKSTAFFQEPGYNMICVLINGKEYCNVGRVVSTSFAVNSANNYVRQYFLSKEIETAEQCREDVRGALPRVQIEKVCSAINPSIGKGKNEQDAWEKIGTCGTNKEGVFQGDCWAKLGNLEENNPQAYQGVRKELCENDGGKVCNQNEKCDGREQITTVSGGYKDVKCCYGTCKKDGKYEELKEELKKEPFIDEFPYYDMFPEVEDKCEDPEIEEDDPFTNPPLFWEDWEEKIGEEEVEEKEEETREEEKKIEEDKREKSKDYNMLHYFKGEMYLLCGNCEDAQYEFRKITPASKYYQKACGIDTRDDGGLMLKYCDRTCIEEPGEREEKEETKEEKPTGTVTVFSLFPPEENTANYINYNWNYVSFDRIKDGLSAETVDSVNNFIDSRLNPDRLVYFADLEEGGLYKVLFRFKEKLAKCNGITVKEKGKTEQIKTDTTTDIVFHPDVPECVSRNTFEFLEDEIVVKVEVEDQEGKKSQHIIILKNTEEKVTQSGNTILCKTGGGNYFCIDNPGERCSDYYYKVDPTKRQRAQFEDELSKSLEGCKADPRCPAPNQCIPDYHSYEKE